ncbi:MAG: PEP-CTERM sorting domain-containing protein [Planctomycetota bacterium]
MRFLRSERALTRVRASVLSVGLVAAGGATAAAQGFDLVFDFGTEISEFSASQLAVFDDVEATYESFITGYQPGVVGLTGAVIDVSAEFIDGPVDFDNGTGTIGGQGGGTLIPGDLNGGFQFFVTDPTATQTTGNLVLDEDDLGLFESFPDGLFSLVFHEVGHALGFGTLWDANGLLDANGDYIGDAGVAAFEDEFGVTSAFIPTSPDEGHWDEGSPLLGNDVLSPVLTLGAANPISFTTQASFADLGYTIIPEPTTSAALLALGTLTVLGRRRRTAA